MRRAKGTSQSRQTKQRVHTLSPYHHHPPLDHVLSLLRSSSIRRIFRSRSQSNPEPHHTAQRVLPPHALLRNRLRADGCPASERLGKRPDHTSRKEGADGAGEWMVRLRLSYDNDDGLIIIAIQQGPVLVFKTRVCPRASGGDCTAVGDMSCYWRCSELCSCVGVSVSRQRTAIKQCCSVTG